MHANGLRGRRGLPPWGGIYTYVRMESVAWFPLGFGVRIMLPMIGMMGVDYGWGFDEIPNNPNANGGQFHFSIGQQF